KKTLWLWWAGPGSPDLELCFRAYLRRFDIEHTYRFVKSTLGWTTPALRTPEQADRWTWLVIAAYTELRLARARQRRLPRAATGPWPRRRPPAAMGAVTRPDAAHPGAGSARISSTACN